ncbi:FecR family protein [Chitinophaga nivalis]|uniref:FecR domain-containing protein n=1 Tax=Chitinophaga nivalis TaxID=2991709 RepID=A0ABT3IH28_9BACT|nr:FecR domain-containing protein [Chitinophaga nivalis]MCW3467034.1 FecR domain-containing protein [Chitinophaga nivalis]MCW3483275.1 FecR domain-containing protein [Chitinophaga nivalis]
MTDHKSDNDIDWDKLLELLDGKEAEASLNEAEIAALAAAREMRARMGAGKFSAAEGWQLFVQERDKRKGRMMRLVKITIAALLILAVGAGLWIMQPAHQPVEVADEIPAGKVRLKLADGRAITIGKDTQVIKNNAGAQIQAAPASLIYTAGGAGEKITAMDTLEVPRGIRFSLKLADGTLVWLNAASRLIYPATFNSTAREVYIEGEAFFEVASNARQPFIVHAGKTAMKVLGTAFNVNTYGPLITATLSSGRLLVTAGQSQTILLPDEQALYNEQDATLRKRTVESRIFTAWKEGDLFFEDATLLDITTILGRNYDYHFVFEDKNLEQLSFTLDMRRPDALQDALNLISKSMPQLHFRVTGKTIYITKRL